ncbi:MAG: YraN family protein [Rikenellaceae bacterium]
MLPSNSQIGSRGERAAVKWLRERGFVIVDLNWRSGRYEIDIVAQRLGVTHFVEVKSRSVSGYTTPEEAITPTKREAMIRAARIYNAQHFVVDEVQFDLIAVEVGFDGELTVRYIENIVEFRW